MRVRSNREFTPLDALTIGLATFRLSRFVGPDESFPLVVEARSRLKKWLGEDHFIVKMLDCPWCSSVWFAAILVPLGQRSGAVRKLLTIPALSAFTGVLSTADSALGRAWRTEYFSWHIEGDSANE